MNRFKKIIIFSLIFTVPVNIFGLIWLHNTSQSYFAQDNLEVAMERGPRLHRFGQAEFLDLKAKTQKLFGIYKPADVELIIKDNNQSRLNSNLPFSGMEYQDDGFMIYQNKALKGKLRYRGDHYYHWLFPTKSWRFKASKKNILNGTQRFNFIIPKDEALLLNHASYMLAKKFDLLAPESDLVSLAINGVYKGPRLMVEQIDESFLRKNKRMPNDIYKGDNIGSSMYMGIDTVIFDHASIWEKPAYNNHYDKDNKIPLDRLFQDFEFANYDLVDKSTFASMMAYIDVTGSGHHDETHNWMFYYDAYYEKMFPIIWDTVGWLQSRKSVDELNIASSEFLVHLYKNFEFHKLKIRSLLKFYQNDKQNFLTELDQAMQKSEALIRQNGYSFNLGRLYFTVEQALEQIDFFYQRVKYRIDLIENHFLGQVDPQHFKYQILSKNEFRLEVDGGKMIEGIGLITNQEITSDSAFVSYFQNGKELQVNITNFLEKRDDGIYINIDLMSNSVIKPGRYRFKTENSKATYDFKIHGLDTNQLNQINLSFANLTNQKLTLQSSNSIAISPFDDNFNHIISLPKTSKPIFLSGDVLIKSDTVYHQNVTIEPGTTFFIDNDVSLKFYGQVTAIGTAEQPITFKPLNDKEPWNAVVVKDAGANGSRFAYCDFLGGSGDKGDLYEYTAMLSVHNVKDIKFEHCGFYDSKRTDDMIHVVYSEVEFRHSKFVRSLADALDADISQVIIADSQFIDSGNDSIDLMTSDAIVYNTQFSNSADKGISIGEGSQLLAYNNTIIDSEIGMQSKDTSLAYIYDTTFIGNNTAVDAYHKNWRYSEGGQITLENCHLERNIEHATVGKKSTITLNNCDIDDASNISRKDQNKNKITISQEERIEHQLKGEFFKNFDPSTIQGAMNGSH